MPLTDVKEVLDGLGNFMGFVTYTEGKKRTSNQLVRKELVF